MLQEIAFTPATIAAVALVVAWAAWAIRRLVRRGLCDCNDHCGGCAQKGRKGHARSGGGCGCCSAAQAMADAFEAKLAADVEAPGQQALTPSTPAALRPTDQ